MPKRRKMPGTRAIERRLFIVCEGAKDKSESAYFKAFIKNCSFNGEKVEVRLVDTNKNTGKELVKEAVKIKEFKQDVAWVVYDKDGYSKHPETFRLAKSKNIKIGFSSISFEIWILLHFKYTSRSFAKSEDVIKFLKANNYIDYEKSDKSVFDSTKNNLDTAKTHAVRLQHYQNNANVPGTPVYNLNPYTNINELIDEIENMQAN